MTGRQIAVVFAQELNLSVFIQIVFHLSCICELHFECTTIACVKQNYFHFTSPLSINIEPNAKKENEYN